jgi:hypothetical protein
MQVEFVHALPLFCHMPVDVLQFCGCCPLHCVWPGEQLPAQAPATHVELVHVTEEPHVPLLVHVCTPLPDIEHCVWPGAHVPWQAPLTHAWLLQATAAGQLPFMSHVCTALPMHRVAPGVHEPVQAPLTHAWFVHAVTAPHAPVRSQA